MLQVALQWHTWTISFCSPHIMEARLAKFVANASVMPKLCYFITSMFSICMIYRSFVYESWHFPSTMNAEVDSWSRFATSQIRWFLHPSKSHAKKQNRLILCIFSWTHLGVLVSLVWMWSLFSTAPKSRFSLHQFELQRRTSLQRRRHYKCRD